MDSGHPPLCDQGSQSQTSRVGWGAMNAGLCPDLGHHIPLEPLCVARSRAEERAGQGRTEEERLTKVPLSVMQHQDNVKDTCGSKIKIRAAIRTEKVKVSQVTLNSTFS